MATKGYYRGRLAPTPTGHLHLGHAHTFWIAYDRAMQAGGDLLLRVDDIDKARCREEYARDAVEDIRWFGIDWTEGPDKDGGYGPYIQSERMHFYLHAWKQLADVGAIYPSPHSRKDVESALNAPHAGENSEPVFPSELRPERGTWLIPDEPSGVNWRFRVRDGETISFVDKNYGEVSFKAGGDFGDFLVWRRDGFPSYELACAVDDHAMLITEVVRGADLLLSTARQLLLYRALGWATPDFYHCPLVRDGEGKRLAKRDYSLSLRVLREQGYKPGQIRNGWMGMNVSPF